MTLRDKIASFGRELSSPPAALGLLFFGGGLLFSSGFWFVSETPSAYAALRQSLDPRTVTSNTLRMQLQPSAKVAHEWMAAAIPNGLIAAMGGLAFVAAKGIRCRQKWAWRLAGGLAGVSFLWAAWSWGWLLFLHFFPESQLGIQWGSAVMFSPYHRFHMTGMVTAMALINGAAITVMFMLGGFVERWWKRRKKAAP